MRTRIVALLVELRGRLLGEAIRHPAASPSGPSSPQLSSRPSITAFFPRSSADLEQRRVQLIRRPVWGSFTGTRARSRTGRGIPRRAVSRQPRPMKSPAEAPHSKRSSWRPDEGELLRGAAACVLRPVATATCSGEATPSATCGSGRCRHSPSLRRRSASEAIAAPLPPPGRSSSGGAPPVSW
jgi:hypothetical protein